MHYLCKMQLDFFSNANLWNTHNFNIYMQFPFKLPNQTNIIEIVLTSKDSFHLKGTLQNQRKKSRVRVHTHTCACTHTGVHTHQFRTA